MIYITSQISLKCVAYNCKQPHSRQSSLSICPIHLPPPPPPSHLDIDHLHCFSFYALSPSAYVQPPRARTTPEYTEKNIDRVNYWRRNTISENRGKQWREKGPFDARGALMHSTSNFHEANISNFYN